MKPVTYDISVSFAYTYETPAAGSIHLLRLMPVDLPGEQRLIAGHLEIEPEPAERWRRTDFFGNETVEVKFRTAHAEIKFRIQARVRREPGDGVFDMTPDLGGLARQIAAWRGLDGDSPLHFTGPSVRVPLDADMTSFARAAASPGMTARAAVEAVGLALHSEMRFDATATTVDTPAREAFVNRHGVCQDFTHIMIAALRGLGIPAGYVSGFLRTIPPAGKPRLEGADAMHAWVRAWCGAETGWIEYDPTNAMFAGVDHVVVARGRDYSDVVPVRGILRVAGGQKSKHAVDMVPLELA